MKFSRLVFLCICVVIAILSESTSHVGCQPMQQSSFFGRRSGPIGNKNRLIFGKRLSSGLEPLDAINQVKQACAMLVGYINSVEATSAA